MMRYWKDEKTDIIYVSRNKRAPVIKVKEIEKNEDGCLACSLFDMCLVEKADGSMVSMCAELEDLGLIERDKEDRAFIRIT